MEPAKPEELVAEIGRWGLRVPKDEFRHRIGGAQKLRKFLSRLVVVEKPQGGRPRHIALKRRAAHRTEYVTIEGQKKKKVYLCMPIIYGTPLLESGMVDSIKDIQDDRHPIRSLPILDLIQPLYTYQEITLDYLCGDDGLFWNQKKSGRVYLQMETGDGKTRQACAIIAALRVPAFVVVPTRSIREQWIEELKEVLPELRVGEYINPTKTSKKKTPSPDTHDVVIGIYNTVRKKEQDFLDGYGLFIIDEAHELHSRCNLKLLWLAQTRYVLGLSATPLGSKSGLDKLIPLHIGNPVYADKNIPGYAEEINRIPFQGRVRKIEYQGDPTCCETGITSLGTTSSMKTIGNLIRDKYRLRMIALEVSRIYRLHETLSEEGLAEAGLGPRPEKYATDKLLAGKMRRHGIFVFAEKRDYLDDIKKAFLEFFDKDQIYVPEILDDPQNEATEEEMGTGENQDEEGTKGKEKILQDHKTFKEKLTYETSILRGGVTKEELKRARSQCYVVITTYGYSRRGVSIQEMTTLVLATPRRNGLHQISGRILRRGSDTSIIRNIIDIVDVRTVLKTQYADRAKIYKQRKYPISRVKTSYTDYAEAEAIPPGPGQIIWEPPTN